MLPLRPTRPRTSRAQRFTALAVVGGLLLAALTACGSDTASEADGATVVTKFGDVTVPEKPERVVALGWGDAETALALGVQPVGASDWLDFGGEGVGPWAEGLYDEKPEIIGTLEPSYEKIAALEPDLILDVKSSGDAKRHEKLQQIAPTVGVPKGGDNYLTSMDEQVTMIAQALGRSDKGKELLEENEALFADAAKKHPELAGKTVSVAAYTSEGWGAYIARNERVRFMTQLGLEQNPSIEKLKADGFSAKVSTEELDVLDADLVVVFPIYVKASAVTRQKAYQEIPAVKDGHVVLFGDDEEDIRSAYSLNSVLSTSFAIEKVVPKLSDALS